MSSVGKSSSKSNQPAVSLSPAARRPPGSILTSRHGFILPNKDFVLTSESNFPGPRPKEYYGKLVLVEGIVTTTVTPHFSDTPPFFTKPALTRMTCTLCAEGQYGLTNLEKKNRPSKDIGIEECWGEECDKCHWAYNDNIYLITMTKEQQRVYVESIMKKKS
jgi:hypothetical protein